MSDLALSLMMLRTFQEVIPLAIWVTKYVPSRIVLWSYSSAKGFSLDEFG